MPLPSDFLTSDPAQTTPDADPLTGAPQDNGITFTPEQAMTLAIADAEPGAYFTVRVKITDNSESGVVVEPISATPAEDEQEMPGDPDASMESEEPATMFPSTRPKPSVKSPKDFGL